MAKRDLRHLLDAPVDEGFDSSKGVPPFVPLLRKFHVFPQRSGEFSCGFCKRQYRNSDYAWMCVANCSEPVLKDLRVSSHVSGYLLYHFCPVCLKQFPNREDANLCLDKCRENVMALLPSEATRLALFSAYSAEAEEHSRVVREFERAERAPAMEATNGVGTSGSGRVSAAMTDNDMNDLVPLLSSGPTLDSLTFASEHDDHPSALVDVGMHGLGDVFANASGSGTGSGAGSVQDSGSEEVSVANSKSGDDAPVEENQVRIKWKPGMKPFRRQDAYYVCNGCASKYFSKVEAEKCFSSHPIDYPEKPDAQAQAKA